MIKKLALLSTVLLAGCSTLSTDNANSNSENINPQQSTNITPEAKSQSNHDTIETPAQLEKNVEQKKTNSSSDKPAQQNKNIKPITALPSHTSSASITTNTNQSPIVMLDNSILTIQTILEEKSDEVNNNPKELKSIIDKYLLPNVDTNKVAAMMLGPKWRTATPQQRTKFINQSLTLLTNIYAKNVAKVGSYKVAFNSLSDGAWKGKKYVQVTGKVINIGNQNNSGSNITVYIIADNNTWKIYDIAVEGISIMQNYQSQFRPISSMDDVIKGVERVNARTKG